MFDMGSDGAERRAGAEHSDQGLLSHDAHAAERQGICSARPIPSSKRQVRASSPIAVTAWVAWQRDGLELIDAEAEAWAGRDVLVAIRDVRWPVLGVWLAAQDVRRR